MGGSNDPRKPKSAIQRPIVRQEYTTHRPVVSQFRSTDPPPNYQPPEQKLAKMPTPKPMTTREAEIQKYLFGNPDVQVDETIKKEPEPEPEPEVKTLSAKPKRISKKAQPKP